MNRERQNEIVRLVFFALVTDSETPKAVLKEIEKAGVKIIIVRKKFSLCERILFCPKMTKLSASVDKILPKY